MDDIARLLATHGQDLQALGVWVHNAYLATLSRAALDFDLAHGAVDAGWPKLTEWALVWPDEYARYARN